MQPRLPRLVSRAETPPPARTPSSHQTAGRRRVAPMSTRTRAVWGRGASCVVPWAHLSAREHFSRAGDDPYLRLHQPLESDRVLVAARVAVGCEGVAQRAGEGAGRPERRARERCSCERRRAAYAVTLYVDWSLRRRTLRPDDGVKISRLLQSKQTVLPAAFPAGAIAFSISAAARRRWALQLQAVGRKCSGPHRLFRFALYMVDCSRGLELVKEAGLLSVVTSRGDDRSRSSPTPSGALAW